MFRTSIRRQPSSSARPEFAPSVQVRSGLFLALAVALLLVMALAVLPAQGQTSVPPTAEQAVGLGLARHPSSQQQMRPARTPGAPFYQSRPLPQDRTTSYANGPVNGLCDIEGCIQDAWQINGGHSTTNSFPGGNNLTALEFAVWAYPGDTVQTIDVSLGDSPFAGTPTTVNVSSVFQFSNMYGYDIDFVTVTGLNLAGPSGTQWLTLQNAVTSQGDPLYWDENSGPSQAQNSDYGTVPSESFNVQWGEPSDCVKDQPKDGFSIIHSFSGGQGGSSPWGVIIDRAGNLYGTATGDPSHGIIYKLAQTISGWEFQHLYSFAGGTDGNFAARQLTLDAQGAVNGISNGGTQNYLKAFSLRPALKNCLEGWCDWTESVLYDFAQDLTNYSGGLVFDKAGNAYGAASSGGGGDCNWGSGCGAIYELTPSPEGDWTETIIYRFTGGSDGYGPIRVLVGLDGNLYGIAGSDPSGTGGDLPVEALRRRLDGDDDQDFPGFQCRGFDTLLPGAGQFRKSVRYEPDRPLRGWHVRDAGGYLCADTTRSRE